MHSRDTGEERQSDGKVVVLLGCTTWAAGSGRLCQSTAVTEVASGAGGAVRRGRNASRGTDAAHRTRRWHG